MLFIMGMISVRLCNIVSITIIKGELLLCLAFKLIVVLATKSG